MKLLQLTQGKFAQVDDSDYEYLNQFKWYTIKTKSKDRFYAGRGIKVNGKQKMLMLHTDIMKPDKGNVTDHIDHNGLNCQRINMRICTANQNRKNRSASPGKTSKYLGVRLHKQAYKGKICLRWEAQIVSGGKQIYLGKFKDEIEAAKCYDKAAAKYHGEYSNFNFKINNG